MNKTIIISAALLAGLGLSAGTADHHEMQEGGTELAMSPPGAPYQKVSELVALPDFIPGIGQLFVDPSTLPAGPFLAYGRDGALVSTIYMVPLDELNPEGGYDNLAAPTGDVDHVDVYYNAGHPGVPEPHAHIVLWHVSQSGESAVSE